MNLVGATTILKTPAVNEWIVVKSICDWADGNKEKKYQAHSARAAVSLVQHVLSNEQRVAALRTKRSSHLRQAEPPGTHKPRTRMWLVLLGAVIAAVLGYHVFRERRRDAARQELAQARRLVQSGRPAAAISAFTAALPALEAEHLVFNAAEARCERALLSRMGDPAGSEPEFRWVISEAVRLGAVELEAKANVGLAAVLLGFGQREEALQLAERAQGLTTNSQDHLLQLNILLTLGKLYTISRRFDSARLVLQSASQKCAELLQAKEDCLLYVGHSLAELEFEQDELQPAARRARQILAATQGATSAGKAITGDTLRLLARIELVVGTSTAARALARQALAVSKLNADTIGHGNAALALGNIELWTGQRELAIGYYSEAYSEFTKSKSVDGLAAVARSRGDAYFELLDFERARSEFSESLRIYRQLGDYRRQGDCLLGLGQVELALGDVDAARQHTSESLAAFTGAGSRYGMAIAKYRQGQVLLAAGELDEARRCFEVLLSFAIETGSRQLSAVGRSSLGRVALAAGNPQGAIRFYETAIAEFVQTGDRLGEADSRRGLGDGLATLGRAKEAQREYHLSIGISKSLGDVAGISCGEQRLAWQACWAEP